MLQKVDYRIMEYPELKGATRIIKSDPSPAQEHPQESHHGLESTVHTQKPWCCDHYPVEPVPETRHPLGEECFPDIQTKPPLTQVQAIPLCPLIGQHREEISVSPSTSFCEEIVTAMKSPLSLLFSRLKRPSDLSHSS